MSDSLKDQLRGVIQDSPPVDPEPEPEAGAETPAEEQKDQGRSLENLQREFQRKLDRQNDAITALGNEIRGIVSTARQTQTQSKDDLGQFSIEYLQQARSQVPEEQLPAFDAYLMERRTDEAINKRVGAFEERQRFNQEREQYNRKAVSMYEELNDINSEFSRQVDAKLAQQPKSFIESNPRIVFDLANEVAAERGVRPKARRIVTGRPAGTNTAPAPTKQQSFINTDEERAEIARRLKGALPKGKEFNMDRIGQREQFYQGEEMTARIKKS